MSIFHDLGAIGYDGVLVFEEGGVFMRTLSLHDRRAIEELHHYFSDRKSKKYGNLCVFHKVNETLFEAARARELEYVAKNLH